LTAPSIGNGVNEPKFSYSSFLDEKVSDYSGELTLNFEDVILEGRNGLDLRIGRTYQTVASGLGEKSLMILPDENGILKNALVTEHSTYLLDRYNLGMGWGFSFPSVQVETEYIPQEVGDTFYYEEKTELYYHSGNGDVYQIEFTSDITDSNLKNYYKKDIQFNYNDTGYNNGSVSSFYSMTLSDKTKQYFALDGRLIGIVDRFGNTIKFEHELHNIANRVIEGNFRYDDDIWTVSFGSDNEKDAYVVNYDGRSDNYSMYFHRNNSAGSYLMSYPIQVKPFTEYNFGLSVKSQYASDIDIEILGFDTAYSLRETKTKNITDYEANTWYDYNTTFKMSSDVRYVIIKIMPDNAKGMYIDNVFAEEPKPLISKITDSIGRTINFEYEGTLDSLDSTGAVTIEIKSPDNSQSKILKYTKEPIEFYFEYMKRDEQRLYWYLRSSNVEGDDGTEVKYLYNGGIVENTDGSTAFQKLYSNYERKNHLSTDSCIFKPLLSGVMYKDRLKTYEYESVRKNLDDNGYYDTLRIKKKYDKYAYLPDGSNTSRFKGELGAVNYSYGGIYNGNSFNNETGYPNYIFNNETALNELWTVTKSGKTTDKVTFSNCELVNHTTSIGDVTLSSDYTNHPVFKNSPTEIKSTITQNGISNDTYVMLSYNDWGGVASETKEVDEIVKNNSLLLEKYTTTYQYNDYHYIIQKSYYNNVDSPSVREVNTFDSYGLLTSSENAAKEKTYYHYENTDYQFLVTKTTMDDPMNFDNLMGGDRVVKYTYDTYGLYPVSVTEEYDTDSSVKSYVYDYITGDILKETLPDNSYSQYEYYSDGKIKSIISPFTQYLNGQMFYTVDMYRYTDNVIDGAYMYDSTVPVNSAEEIRKYTVFPHDGSVRIYSLEINLYDAIGNLKLNRKYDLGNTDSNGVYNTVDTKYYYDNYDRLIKTVDEEGHAFNYSYDGYDRPVNITDSENNRYIYSYNDIERKTDIILNGATEITNRNLLSEEYDIYGNVIKRTAYPENNLSETLTESYTYNLNNNITSYTNPNGAETEYEYDEAGRLKETVLPNGVKASSTHSAFNEPAFEKIYDSQGGEKLSRASYRNEKGDLNMKFYSYDNRLTDSSSYSADKKETGSLKWTIFAFMLPAVLGVILCMLFNCIVSS